MARSNNNEQPLGNPVKQSRFHNLTLSQLYSPARYFGVGAGEILAAFQIAMIAGLPYSALRDAVLTHPTRNNR